MKRYSTSLACPKTVYAAAMRELSKVVVKRLARACLINRNLAIGEHYFVLGKTQRQIAIIYGLSPQRIGVILNELRSGRFGYAHERKLLKLALRRTNVLIPDL